MSYTGRCLCGSVTFRIDGELDPIQVCHCQQCRRAQGGPFATNIPVAAESFSLLTGKDTLKGFESSPGKTRYFCANCGSPVFSARESLPSVVRVRAGLIDQPLNAPLSWHAHVGTKSNWWPIADDLPQFVAAPDPAKTK